MNLFGLTDIGAVRLENQDSYAIRELDEQLAVAVVCDGMGGANAGNVASAVAVETFTASVEELVKCNPPQSDQGWAHLIRDACHKANQVVHDLSQTTPEYQGMGTTLVGALLLPQEWLLVNVGDSRGYVLREGEIRQVTQDHSLVQALVNRGELTQEQARIHPKKNLITRALGVDGEVQEDLFRVEVQPGDRLLLCSDGLSNVISDTEILRLCQSGALEDCSRQLLALAMERGAPDNVTIVMAQM